MFSFMLFVRYEEVLCADEFQCDGSGLSGSSNLNVPTAAGALLR